MSFLLHSHHTKLPVSLQPDLLSLILVAPTPLTAPQTRRPSQHAQPKRSCIGDACHLLLHGSHRCGYSVWSCSRVILMQAMISLSCSHYASAQRRRCSCLQVRLPRVQRRERQDLSLCELAAASRRHRNWTDIRAFRLHKLNGHFRTRSVWLNPSKADLRANCTVPTTGQMRCPRQAVVRRREPGLAERLGGQRFRRRR